MFKKIILVSILLIILGTIGSCCQVNTLNYCGNDSFCNQSNCLCTPLTRDNGTPFSCSELNGDCCPATMQCIGQVVSLNECECCLDNCLPPCTPEEPINCLTEESCLNVSGYWCIKYCEEPLCLKCAQENVWVCQTKESCEKEGGVWYPDNEGEGYCYSKAKSDCENNGGEWLVDEEGVSWCFYSSTCSPNNLGLCQTKDLCLNVNGYWCNDYCSQEPCPTCSVNKPWNCLNKTECEAVNNHWCVLEGNEWCQQNECEGGEGVCDSTENCETSDDCTCPEDLTCDPDNNNADYRGCVTVSSVNYNDSYCNTNAEDCSNSPVDCACPQDKICDPVQANADIKGCVTVITDYNKTIYNDGVCHEGENCNNSLDCACPDDSFCDLDNANADEQGCVLYENLSDNRCRGEENCQTSPNDCSCPNSYFCNLSHPRALPNGCVLNKTNYYNIHICKLGDNCLVNPACACAPGEKCDPDNQRSDNIGCVPRLTCPEGVSRCCGNRECEQGECSSCPVDCTARECADNGVCNLLIGENCETSVDCSCSQGYVCNISSIYSNNKGCVPENNAFCGNNVLEPGENSTNCCVDAGCPEEEYCVPTNGNIVQEVFADVYYNPRNYVCREFACGNGVLDYGEDSGSCCIDAGCEVGVCKKTDIGVYKCVIEEDCGNGLVEDYESSINCCVDAGCPPSLTCTDNKCVEVKDESFECSIDDDCICFKGCGVISREQGLTNPQCTDTSKTCANVLAVCVNNTCQAELVSVEGNEVIDYIAALKEIKTRLSSFDEVIVNISLSLSKAKRYYESVNNSQKAVFFNGLLELVSEYNIDYLTLIQEVEEAIQSPSEEEVNYIRNRIGELENRLIELISRVLSITVGETSVKDLLEGDS